MSTSEYEMEDDILPDPAQELLLAAVFDTLDPEERQQLEALLKLRPELTCELGSLERVRDLLAYSAIQAPPTRLEGRVLSAFDRARPAAARRWFVAAGVVAAGLVGVLVWDNLRLRGELVTVGDLVTILRHPNSRLFSLRGTGEANEAAGSIVMDLDRREAVVAIENLPMLGGRQVYHLWAVVDGEPRNCGQFKADGKGQVLDRVQVPAGLYNAVVSGLLVTRGSQDAIDRPQGEEVMVSVL